MAITGEPKYQHQSGTVANAIPAEAAQAPSADTAAVLTLSANASKGWVIDAVRWSYTAAPTGGSLTIAWSTFSEVFPITAGGPGFLPVNARFPINTAVTITLAAGGGAVAGKVYASGGLV